MVKIITIASHKGGVGKTTAALNLAYSLSRFGDRVLMIEGDPQGALAISSNLKKATSLGLSHVLSGTCSLDDCITYTRDRMMAMVGFGSNNPETVLAIEEEARKGQLGPLVRSLGQSFQYILIDAPAGTGSLVQALLRSSDGVILAIHCRILALKSLPSFLKTVRHIQQQDRATFRLEGVLVTMVNSKNMDEMTMLKEMKQLLPEGVLFNSLIPCHDLYEAASLKSLPVAMLKNSGHRLARPWLDLAMEVKEREKISQTDGDDDEAEGLF